MKIIKLGHRVEIIDHIDEEPITLGTVIGTATIIKDGFFETLFVVKLDEESQGYIHRASNGVKAGFISTVIIHPDNLLRI